MTLKKYKNFGFSHLKKPTPKKWKRFGIFLATFSGAFLATAFLTTIPAWLGIIVGLLGAIGAGITKMFSDVKLDGKSSTTNNIKK
jgi:heme O synthase-like polyprenyltransferase